MAETQPLSFGCGQLPRARKGRTAHLSPAKIFAALHFMDSRSDSQNDFASLLLSGEICLQCIFLPLPSFIHSRRMRPSFDA
jgi:hypothetical protein